MKTVKELGRAKKLQSPGEYDDISDEDLGRAIKIKYPGQYDDFLDAPTFDQGSYLEPVLSKNVRSLIKFYDPGRGRLSSWWQRGKAQGRADLLKVQNEEQLELIRQAVMMEQAVLEGRRSQAEFNIFLAENETLFVNLKAEIELTIQATRRGMNRDDYSKASREIAVIQAQTEKEKELETLRHQQELEKTRLESDIKLEEHKIKSETELNNEIRLAQEEVRLAIIADYLTDNQKVSLIQELLDDLYKQIDEIEKSPTLSDKAKKRMIEDREASIERFRKQRDETADKLLPQNHRQKISR